MRAVVRVGSQVSLDLDGIPEGLLKDVERHLTFRNPLHKAMVRAGRHDPKVTEHLTCWHVEEGILYTTRGFARRLVRLLQAHRVKAVYKDETNKTEDLPDIGFYGELKGYQWDAVRDIGDRRFGILTGPIGCGKKVVALYMISQARVPALVIVRHKWQLYQWKEIAEQFLGGAAVGIVGDGKHQKDRPVVVGTDKSLYRHIDDLAGRVGYLVVDQCDQAHLNIFFKLVRKVSSPYMLGLATGRKRRDGLNGLMTAYLGPVIHKIPMERVYEELSVERPHLIKRATTFDFDLKENYAEMISALSKDEERNILIVSDILAETADPQARVIVVCERRAHMERLKEMLEENYRIAETVSAITRAKDLEHTINRFDRGKLQVVCVTVRSLHLVKVKRVSHLFMASPVSHGEFVAQAVGKVLWTKGEASRVFDYLDKPVALRGAFKKRQTIYGGMGVWIK